MMPERMAGCARQFCRWILKPRLEEAVPLAARVNYPRPEGRGLLSLCPSSKPCRLRRGSTNGARGQAEDPARHCWPACGRTAAVLSRRRLSVGDPRAEARGLLKLRETYL